MTRGIPDGELPTMEVRQSRKPLALSSLISDKG